MQGLAIGVAGGNRETRAVVVAEGRVVALAMAHHGCNPHFRRPHEIAQTLADVLGQVARLLSLRSVTDLGKRTANLVLSLPGIRRPEDEIIGIEALSYLGWASPAVAVVDETQASLAAACLAEGISVIAGSGATVAVIRAPNTRVLKFDGLGPFLGDKGGAIRIAMTLLQQVAYDDERGTVHRLWERIRRSVPELDQPADIRTWLDNLVLNSTDWPYRLSPLADVVVEAAEQDPNATAADLLKEAAGQLTATIGEALSASSDSTLRIVLDGRLIRASTVFRDTIISAVTKANRDIVLPIYHRVVGTALLASVTTEHGKICDSVPHSLRMNSSRGPGGLLNG